MMFSLHYTLWLTDFEMQKEILQLWENIINGIFYIIRSSDEDISILCYIYIIFVYIYTNI